MKIKSQPDSTPGLDVFRSVAQACFWEER